MLTSGLTLQLISEMPVPALCPRHVFPEMLCAKTGCHAVGRTHGLERASVSDGMGFVAVTYQSLIIGSSSSLRRAVGRLVLKASDAESNR